MPRFHVQYDASVIVAVDGTDFDDARRKAALIIPQLRNQLEAVGECFQLDPYSDIDEEDIPDGSYDTTVQVAVQAGPTGTVLRFHQERLAGPDERQRQRTHWQAALARVERALEQAAGTA